MMALDDMSEDTVIQAPYAPNAMAIHPVVVGIFQFGPNVTDLLVMDIANP